MIPEMAPAAASTGKPEAKVDALKTEAARAESAKAVAASVVAARIASAKSAAEKISPTRPPNPAVVSNAPIVSVQSHRWIRSLVLTAALVICAAAIGLPKVRNSIPWPLHTARGGQPEQPSQVAEGVMAAEQHVTPPRTRAAAKAAGADASSTPQQAATSARPKSTTSAQRKAVRDPNTSIQQVAPASATQPPTPAAAPPHALVAAAEPPRSIEPTGPMGRFFEPSDVDESPRIATRVEPRLPADLPTRRLSDVVVVRVLVSQGGQPFRVSLLRRSKQGRSLDDAVVAAVTQWTFSPAKKRGEAVSCWYNIGVPLGQAN
jgi:TonB family protein